jgi:hypothetical protein
MYEIEMTCNYLLMTRLRNFCKKWIIITMLALIPVSIVMAQETTSSAPSNGRWSFLVEPYLLFPFLSGKTGVGKLPDLTLDASAADIFSHLQIGAMLFAEISNDRWAFSSDLFYANLKQDVKTGVLINSGDITVKQFALEPAGLRRVTPWLEVGIGGVLNSIQTGINITENNIIGEGTTDLSKELTQTWFDPMLITRIKNKSGQKFIYQFRGEIGGFGAGSDLAWVIQGLAGYRFSKLFQVTGGYKIISIDYEKGSGEDRFLYDAIMSGPMIRLGFNL